MIVNMRKLHYPCLTSLPCPALPCPALPCPILSFLLFPFSLFHFSHLSFVVQETSARVFCQNHPANCCWLTISGPSKKQLLAQSMTPGLEFIQPSVAFWVPLRSLHVANMKVVICNTVFFIWLT